MNNPFPYSLDNKRYLTFNYYCQKRFGTKIAKVPVDAGFSCPNRDGSLSSDGCLFCYKGSGQFPIEAQSQLFYQFQQRRQVYLHKWPTSLPWAYFQAYSNTYGPLPLLKSIYEPFIKSNEVAGIVISTRADCLDDEKISWLASVNKQKEIWLEIGIQSCFDTTLTEMNRQHDYVSCVKVIKKLHQAGLWVSVHLIDGWPSETKEMMIQTAKSISELPIQAVKFHMLHILKNTPLADLNQKKPITLLSEDEYVAIVIQQLMVLPQTLVIERLTGDGMADDLIAPLWTKRKIAVIDHIDAEMARQNVWQGKEYAGL